MDHIPLKFCVEWMERGQSTINLLTSFFDERLKLERITEALWKTFGRKWSKKFMDLEDEPLFQSRESGNSLTDILKLLTKEPLDISMICRSVKSKLDQKHRDSPTALLERWNATHGYNYNTIEDYKATYRCAEENLADAERNVLEVQRALNNGEDVAALYKTVINLYRSEQTSFCKTMGELKWTLGKNARGMMDAIKGSVNSYLNAINEREVQKQQNVKVQVAKAKLKDISVETITEKWLEGLQDQIRFPNYNLDIKRPVGHKKCNSYKYAQRPCAMIYTIKEEPEEECLFQEDEEIKEWKFKSFEELLEEECDNLEDEILLEFEEEYLMELEGEDIRSCRPSPGHICCSPPAKRMNRPSRLPRRKK